MLGTQSRDALEKFRAFGGAQSYPSRTKDKIPVDFSTGSVGLGVAITLFASLVQDYLTAHGWLDEKDRGRFVALIGDAELDEGNIYEAIIEGAKHDVRNLWWIVDYNRQSLDATTADRMFGRFDEIFASCGWRVETLKYGKLLQAAFREEGGEALRDRSRIAREKRARSFGTVAVPAIATPTGEDQSTQAAFGRILLELSKAGGDLVDRIVTTSPDVTVSTNLGAWVNQRGLFRRSDIADVFAEAKIASAQKWSSNNKGQHIELGIAESNLFLMLAAAGLSGDLFGTRLFPIGTLYDPFIARGLDSLNYACYQDARFLLVATPSGITLGPEGGAHQSINPPLIALGQPGLRHYEPAFADELAAMMHEAFRLIDDPAGDSTYLRLSTRSIEQVG